METDFTECNFQQIGRGTLLCKVAAKTKDDSINAVDPEDCLNCPAGRIYRELGCSSVVPDLHIQDYFGGRVLFLENLFCKVRKKETDYEYCEGCSLRTGDIARSIPDKTGTLLKEYSFYSSLQEIERVRILLAEGNHASAIAASLSSLENTMKDIHRKLGKKILPDSTFPELFRSTGNILGLNANKGTILYQATQNLLFLLESFEELRHTLQRMESEGDDVPDFRQYVAELVYNISSSISSFLITRMNSLKATTEN